MTDARHTSKVIVVGTGAGGAVAAATLAEAGIDTLILEEGEYFKPSDHGTVFDGFVRMYLSGGTTITVGRPPISLTLGRAVGGTTAINSSTCFRPPRKKVESWGGPSYEELQPFTDEVERRINAHVVDEDLLGGNWRVMKRGCDALGIEIRPLRHNVRDCKKRGRCQFGCPEGAKQSTDVSFIPSAQKAGARLLTGHLVEKLLVERGRAVGVAGQSPAGRFEARADTVVLSMGALGTPVFLQKQGLANSSRLVGRGLQIHPACRVVAEFDEIIDGHTALPQGAFIDKWADRGLMLEGISIHPGFMIAMLPGVGHDLKNIAGAYRRLSAFGAFVDDSATGVVLPGRFGTRFTALYQLAPGDARKLCFGMARIAEIHFAAGAKRVFTASHKIPIINNINELAAFESAPARAVDLELGAFHPLGTCRMGGSAGKSVVKYSLETHDINNLYIMDGSVIPGSLGVNPQVTIMTLAMRAASILADNIKQ